MEIVNGAGRLGVGIAAFLTRAARGGLDTIPGTAAEILDDDVRWVLTKGKLPADAWVEVVTTAHALGIRSSSTMMYGHVDAPHHWAAHLHLLRRLQLENLELGMRASPSSCPCRSCTRRRRSTSRGSPARARPSPTPCACTRSPGSSCRAHRQHPAVVGEDRPRGCRRACSPPARTTSVARSWRRRSAGWPEPTTGSARTRRRSAKIAEAAGRVPAERTTDYSRIEPAGIRYRFDRNGMMMEPTPCQTCGTLLPPDATQCPTCGATPFTGEQAPVSSPPTHRRHRPRPLPAIRQPPVSGRIRAAPQARAATRRTSPCSPTCPRS
jgi:FO synthase